MTAAVSTAANTAQNNRRNSRHGRLIIAASNRDGDRLIDIGTKVVGDPDDVRLVNTRTFCQGLGGRQAVVEVVGPLAGGGIDGDAAIGRGGNTENGPDLIGT